MKILVFLLIFVSFFETFSQNKKFNFDSLSKKDLRFLFVPSVTVSPEVGVMFGGFLDYYYNSGGKSDTLTRPSVAFIDLQYSTRRQLNVEVFNSTFTKNEKYYFFTRAGFYDDYEQYWGETKGTLANEDYIITRYKRYQAFGRVTKNLGKKVFFGIGYQYNKYFSFDFGPTEFTEYIPLNPASSVVGGGLVLSIDRRDNQFSPTKGFFLDISNYVMLNASTGKYAFNAFNFDIRKYFEQGRNVWANQLLVGSQVGDVPSFEKTRLGGAKMMRGFFKGRFRDNNYWTAQTEYRYRLIPFMRIAFFASVGNTAPTINTLFKQDLLVAGGSGLRFRLNEKKKVYARFDIAYTNKKTLGYYLRVSDAF